VVSEIDNLLAKQAIHLKHEEAATLRRFKQKLADVSQESVKVLEWKMNVAQVLAFYFSSNPPLT